MRGLFVLFLLAMSLMARPLEEKLELLIEEEILLEKVQQELQKEIAIEERKIKRQLQGEESMMNFLNDYSKRFSFNQASGSQFRPGR